MKIKSLSIKNFKGLRDFEIDFNDKFTVIIGENGTGKTTILDTIYNILNYDVVNNLINVNGVITEKKDYFTSIDKDFAECSITINFQNEENLFSEYSDLTDSKFRNEIKNYSIGVSRNSVGGIATQGSWSAIARIRSFASLGESKFNIPRVVYLPTEINFKKYKPESIKKIERLREFGLILNSETISNQLKDFLAYQYHKDLEDLDFGGKKGNRISNFKNILNMFFKDEGKEFLGIQNLEPLFKTKSGKIHSVDELSSGEKQIFFRAGSILEYELKNSIILIDEPEMSMHPEWQQKILDFYKKIGRDNQLIIATHSPHIISSCKKEEVRALIKENDKIVVKDYINETYGKTVEQLLLSIFDLKSVRDIKVQENLNKFKELYVNKDKINEKQKNQMEELKHELTRYLAPDDPEISLLDIEITTKKLKNILESFEDDEEENDA